MKLSNFVKLALPSAVLALGLISTPASAATTASTSMQVSAQVQTSCSVSATSLTFSAYTGTVLQATSSITVSCNTNDTVTIGLSKGQGDLASANNPRVMTGTSPMGDYLNYSLYSDNAYSIPWTDLSGTNYVTATVDGEAPSPLPVYGRIAGGQNSPADTYTDSITVTVSY